MRKVSLALFGVCLVLSFILLLQSRSLHQLRLELNSALNENAQLRQQTAQAQEQAAKPSMIENAPSASNPTRLQELESEVLRLRNASGRAARAEAELAELKSHAAAPQSTVSAPIPNADVKPVTEPLVAYIGEAVLPPADLQPAYTKEGLQSAIEQAAQKAGVTIKKLEIETSEFPFLTGVVCNDDADFEKLKEQFKKMDAYEYSGSVSSHGVYSFNLVPHRAFPQDTSERIDRRTTLRQQKFYKQLVTGAH